jgi:hypothetical protein
MNCEHKQIVVKLFFTMYIITKIFYLTPLDIEFGYFPNKSSIFEAFFISFPLYAILGSDTVAPSGGSSLSFSAFQVNPLSTPYL